MLFILTFVVSAAGEVYHYRLSGTGEPRFLSGTKIQIDNEELIFFTTHLSLRKKNRIPQIHDIIDIINETPGQIVLTGDLNTESKEELALLQRTRLNRLNMKPTYPSWEPMKCLDHMFYTPELNLSVSFQDKFGGVPISDHLPILAQFSLQKSTYLS